MITELTITLSQPFYSRYEADFEIVNAKVTAVGVSGDSVTMKLVRKTAGADLELDSQVVTVTGDSLEATALFDLTTYKDSSGFSLVRSSTRIGDYRIIAEASSVVQRKAFTVTPISPTKMRTDFLFGLPLSSAELTEPDGVTPLKMKDETIIEHVLSETESLARTIYVELEPTIIITEKYKGTVTVYDQIRTPGHYYPPKSRLQWMIANLPQRQLRKINNLTGWFNQDRLIDIGPEWQVRHELSGSVTLVPSNAAVLQWQTLGIGLQALSFGQVHIPNFWHYSIIAGLDEIPSELLHYIGKRAALDVLNLASAARFPSGAISFSLSRDGVTESSSVNPKGPYGQIIEQYNKELGVGSTAKYSPIANFRKRYGGVGFAVV